MQPSARTCLKQDNLTDERRTFIEHLHAVADAEHGDAALENGGIVFGCIFRVDGVRTAGNDDSLVRTTRTRLGEEGGGGALNGVDIALWARSMKNTDKIAVQSFTVP